MSEPMPGDFAVTKIPGISGRAIALGQWVIRNPSPVQHAYVYVGNGDVVQAMPGGAQLAQMHQVEPAYMWSGDVIPLTAVQRVRIANAARAMVGTPYSFVDYLSIGLYRWGVRPAALRRYVANSHHMICSQLVDFLYAASGANLFGDDRFPGDVTPSDLFDLLRSKGAATP